MHELGIVLNVIDRVEEIAKENKVKKVTKLTLEIGEVSSIVPSYFSDCFEWAKKKTDYMKDTELEMIILEGLSYCRDCKKTYKTTYNTYLRHRNSEATIFPSIHSERTHTVLYA